MFWMRSKASLVLAFLLAVAGLARAQGTAFAVAELAGASGLTLQALERAPLAPPLRYRVVVVPGSGCAGMDPIAERYFAGLLHAKVLVLHKPWASIGERSLPGNCPPEFVRQDALGHWLAHARTALTAWLERQPEAVPTWLVGISEGAELLPALAQELPQVAGLVLLSASGLDPQEAGALQAQRLGQDAAWQALARAQAGDAPDTEVLQGRSVRYWRDLWRWRIAEALVAGPWPLLQVWGSDDALVPQEAYRRFGARAQGRRAPLCAIALEGADHGLQTPQRDGVQWVWAQLERAARCAPSHPGCLPCAQGEP